MLSMNIGMLLCLRLAVHAAHDALNTLKSLAHRLKIGDAQWVRAGAIHSLATVIELTLRVVLPLKKFEDECHAYKLAILNLTEVGGAWVVIYVDSDLIDAW